MAEVTARGLKKRYGDKYAIGGIDLHITSGEFITLLGPSGCGKTTTLRCLAGLERLTEGRVDFGSRTVADPLRRIFVPPEKRQIGMVFQSYALWPHMTVFENVAYPLKLARIRKKMIAARVNETLATLGLEEHVKRPAMALSGGQQQRVALARAMVGRPELILFDEPLSNLDAKLRYRMGLQIRSLHDEVGATSVYVTHDQEEAITLSDRIVVMNGGRIEQLGTPSEVYNHPVSAFVADFMGFQNIWPGRVTAVQDDRATVRIPDTDVVVVGSVTSDMSVGDVVDVAFRSAHVAIDSGEESDSGSKGETTSLDGTVVHTTYLGSGVNVLVDVHGLQVRTRLGEGELGRRHGEPPRKGDPVRLRLPASQLVVLGRQDAA